MKYEWNFDNFISNLNIKFKNVFNQNSIFASIFIPQRNNLHKNNQTIFNNINKDKLQTCLYNYKNYKNNNKKQQENIKISFIIPTETFN